MLKTEKQTTLRALLARGKPVMAAGVGDALSARLANGVEGIDALLSSGFAISATQLGLPDVEMYTRTENVQAVERMAYVASKPIIADIDTGYGNAVSVIKSVHEFERAGAEGVIIEDQISPKRCPICVDETNLLIPAEEAAGKIRAAAENRSNPDTVIIARTDATNIDECVRRARMYHAAGADLVQPIASRAFSGKEELKEFIERVECPVSLVVVSWVEKLTREEIEWLNPAIVHFALISVSTLHAAVKQALTSLGASGSLVGVDVARTAHGELVSDLGMDQVQDLEMRYLPQESELTS
ncbi:MAG: isocitrate lyase/PEP mutase family protein [Ectothiorhodospiraceae bacterium]|nr:isocitrate lyase/PEP mutase family protein [Ectothiorhodospiraceae bacterium]